ncbi:LysR family transcriptional regulator [Pseudomonas aegrilactucae]|uniref:LysR family transcriptional regulator n=1 Tax=Pseudomonas aegrilactucae TaxID=2854028 RepID=A0A9Q3ADK9_9PSED|nr:LysR family transcriptional regulator [Pseudomonas aegrilactucae]MBV6288767.1 LysR family transcriptional regulator [Pseudomonas aegrilactucae]
MHSFDLDQLKTLVAAVEAGSLSAAAPARFLSQSSLSEQLRKLEQRAGQPLLVRSKAGVKPTAAGERLLVHARQILALSDAAWRDLHQVPLEGELNLGITDYFRPADLTRLLARLGQQYPRLRLRTLIGKSDELEVAHRHGQLDLAIVMRAADAIGLPTDEARRLHTEPLVWAQAPGSALGQPLALAVLPQGCSLHRLARSQLEAHGTAYVVTHVASGVAGLQAAVAAGLGVACMNRSSLQEGHVVEVAHGLMPPLPMATFVLLAQPGGELSALIEVVVQALAG